MNTLRNVCFFVSILAILIWPTRALTQVGCPAPQSFCHSSSYCVGINAGYFDYWSLDRPFIDQARGAAISVAGYTPNTIIRNSSIPLDTNGYPVEPDKSVTVLFYANTSATFHKSMLPAGQYVVMWDGAAINPIVQGGGTSGMVYDAAANPNRLEFTFNPQPVANSWYHRQCPTRLTPSRQRTAFSRNTHAGTIAV